MKTFSIFNFSVFKKIILSLLFIIGVMQGAKAYTGICWPEGGPHIYNYNFGQITVIDPKRNKEGYLFQQPNKWNIGGDYAASCDCPAGSLVYQTYFKGTTNLPLGHNDGTSQFYIVNDYLESKSQFWIGGSSAAVGYYDIPFTGVSNQYKNHSDCATPGQTRPINWRSGNSGKVWLYIRKPFVGVVYVENVNIADIYANDLDPENYGNLPLSSVYLSGMVSVPENCEINAGQIITVDFGKIWSGDFTTKGQKPDGYVAKNIKASMKCNNINAYTNLTIRFQSEISNDYPDAIKTNNPDIGVEIINDNGHLVLPNTGLIPFNIDDKYEASVTFKAQPVSTTGNPPSAGQFQAQAYIRVDFA